MEAVNGEGLVLHYLGLLVRAQSQRQTRILEDANRQVYNLSLRGQFSYKRGYLDDLQSEDHRLLASGQHSPFPTRVQLFLMASPESHEEPWGRADTFWGADVISSGTS